MSSSALSQAIEVLRRRIDRFGVAEPVITVRRWQPHFGPAARPFGIGQTKRDGTTSEARLSLEFRMVNDNSDEIIRNGDPIPPGYELMKQAEKDTKGQTPH